MTADSYPLDHDFLARTATRIINEMRHQPRGLRRDVEAARHDRVGVGAGAAKPLGRR